MSTEDVRPNTRRRSPAARPTDDELLDAARDVFAERGFKASTMDAIAERANSTKPTLYAHFGDKAALYQAVFNREAAALRQWVLNAYEAATGQRVREQVRVYVMALFDYATTHPVSFRLLLDTRHDEGTSPARRDVVDAITERVAGQINQVITKLDRRPGPGSDLLASIMVSLVGGAAWHTLRHQLDPKTAGALATSFITAAIANFNPDWLDAVTPAEDR
jgi:AcrR family transcriptional regulator